MKDPVKYAELTGLVLTDNQKKLLQLLAEEPNLQLITHRRGMNMHNNAPNRYGRWVKRGNTLTFQLNKKGKHREARRGEL